MSRFSWFALGVLLLSASACGGSNSPSSPSSTPPRAEFAQVDLTVGTGTAASNGRAVTVAYTGWLYDPSRTEQKGTQFDSGTYSYVLGSGGVIRGWDLGLVGMRERIAALGGSVTVRSDGGVSVTVDVTRDA